MISSFKKKLIKDKCEIETCDVEDPKLLELHHIVERIEINTSNHNFNLAILCANCHKKLHAGSLRIIGVYPSTRGINHRVLVYELNGTCNIPGITEPYYVHIPKSFKIGE